MFVEAGGNGEWGFEVVAEELLLLVLVEEGYLTLGYDAWWGTYIYAHPLRIKVLVTSTLPKWQTNIVEAAKGFKSYLVGFFSAVAATALGSWDIVAVVDPS